MAPGSLELETRLSETLVLWYNSDSWDPSLIGRGHSSRHAVSAIVLLARLKCCGVQSFRSPLGERSVRLRIPRQILHSHEHCHEVTLTAIRHNVSTTQVPPSHQLRRLTTAQATEENTTETGGRGASRSLVWEPCKFSEIGEAICSGMVQSKGALEASAPG